MGLAYGTPISDHRSVEDWEATAREHYRRWNGNVDVLYRVEAVRYAAIEPYADMVTGDGAWYTTAPRLELHTFSVAKWTPTGARLSGYCGGSYDRWTSLEPGRKQWASRTAAEALEQFGNRRRAQVHILKGQLRRAERELALCDAAFSQEKLPSPHFTA